FSSISRSCPGPVSSLVRGSSRTLMVIWSPFEAATSVAAVSPSLEYPVKISHDMNEPTTPRPLDGPLSDVRVLDLSRVLAGPHCGRLLCDLGADVIKIEPPEGDLTRFATMRKNSLSAYFVQQNVGKRNLSLDLSKAEGVELILK